jgi:hypothetical protein
LRINKNDTHGGAGLEQAQGLIFEVQIMTEPPTPPQWQQQQQPDSYTYNGNTSLARTQPLAQWRTVGVTERHRLRFYLLLEEMQRAEPRSVVDVMHAVGVPHSMCKAVCQSATTTTIIDDGGIQL